jgi:hypothetical protein
MPCIYFNSSVQCWINYLVSFKFYSTYLLLLLLACAPTRKLESKDAAGLTQGSGVELQAATWALPLVLQQVSGFSGGGHAHVRLSLVL